MASTIGNTHTHKNPTSSSCLWTLKSRRSPYAIFAFQFGLRREHRRNGALETLRSEQETSCMPCTLYLTYIYTFCHIFVSWVLLKLARIISSFNQERKMTSRFQTSSKRGCLQTPSWINTAIFPANVHSAHTHTFVCLSQKTLVATCSQDSTCSTWVRASIVGLALQVWRYRERMRLSDWRGRNPKDWCQFWSLDAVWQSMLQACSALGLKNALYCSERIPGTRGCLVIQCSGKTRSLPTHLA